jgi:hypothetical protein
MMAGYLSDDNDIKEEREDDEESGRISKEIKVNVRETDSMQFNIELEERKTRQKKAVAP